jgi:hypothetical protein
MSEEMNPEEVKSGEKPGKPETVTQESFYYLQRQNEKIQKELEALRKTEEDRKTAELSEIEKAKKVQTDLEAKLSEKDKEIQKKDLAIKKVGIFNELQIPHDFLDFVTAEDEESLRITAKRFKDSLLLKARIPGIDAEAPANNQNARPVLSESQKVQAQKFGFDPNDEEQVRDFLATIAPRIEKGIAL